MQDSDEPRPLSPRLAGRTGSFIARHVWGARALSVKRIDTPNSTPSSRPAEPRLFDVSSVFLFARPSHAAGVAPMNSANDRPVTP
jgi:hypothetical protein